MSETQRTTATAMQAKIIGTLLALLSAAFLAWAGVVWSATSNVSRVSERLETFLDTIEKRVTKLELEQDRHEALPGHREANERIDVLRQRLNKVEDEVSK